MDFTFRLSIDNHDLHIIASDGGDVVTTKVESVMIASGERYDFWIDASDPIGNGSYWIRAETLERFKNDEVRCSLSSILNFNRATKNDNT